MTPIGSNDATAPLADGTGNAPAGVVDATKATAMAATAANVAAATATGRLTRSSSSLGTMVAGRRRPRSPRSSAGGGTSRSGHPSGIRFGWRDNHAATSRRLSQLVYIAALANSWFVSGSRRGPRPRQKVSMASRSYVLPLPATNTGSRIIAFVMGQRSSSGSSSPGWRVGASAVAPSSFASSSASACPRGEVFGEGVVVRPTSLARRTRDRWVTPCGHPPQNPPATGAERRVRVL